MSINTEDINFVGEESNQSNSIAFTLNDSYHYTLSFDTDKIVVSNDYDGYSDYLKYNDIEETKYINDVKFDYDPSNGLLISSVTYLSNKTLRYSYVVRTALWMF